MPEPYERLSPRERDRAIGALYSWAAAQPDKTEPVIRFLDGAALSPQDLLDERPPPWKSEGTSLTAEETSRSWRHMLNLITLSIDHGESLEEIIDQLLPQHQG
jgi:hypothetical protein